MTNNNQLPLVSVMIPYYNCEKYITETIDSVEKQSYSNIETIIVDDGSTEESAHFLGELLKNKPNIQLIIQGNQGLSTARNQATSLAQGQYFLFLDADDVILPTYIEKCISVLENNIHCKVVYPMAEFFDAQTGIWPLPPYDGIKSLLLSNRIPAMAMHRANDFHAIGGFDKNLSTHEDWDFWIRLLSKGGEVYQIPEVLFLYRKRPDGSSLIDHLERNPALIREDWQRVYEKNRQVFLQYQLGYSDLIQQTHHLSSLKEQYQTLLEEKSQLLQQSNNELEQKQTVMNEKIALLQLNNSLIEQKTAIEKQHLHINQENNGLLHKVSTLTEQNHELKQYKSHLKQKNNKLEQLIKNLNKKNYNLEQHVHDLTQQILVLQQHKLELEQQQASWIQHLSNRDLVQKKYKNLWTVKVLKPIIKTEQAISSANRYRKGFRLLVREKGSIGKAYQFLRHMYKDHNIKTVKYFLRSKVLPFNYSTKIAEISTQALTHFDISNKAAYQEWIRQNDTLSHKHITDIYKKINNFKYQPKISVLMPVYNVDIKWLAMAIDSVREQFYENWELCISDDASPNTNIRPLLEQYTNLDPRIKTIFREKNGHISENSNSALSLATGEWLALMDHDDTLPPHAFFEIVDALQNQKDTSLIYTDEDKIDENNARFMPHFKSDFNLDLLYGQNYISHLGVYRTEIAKEIGGFRKGLEGSQDYDFLLRYLLKVDHSKIIHIPKILYHWRAIEGSTALASGEKSYTTEAGIKALQHHFSLLNKDVTVTRGKADNLYRVQWHWTEQPLVSLIIPTRNGYAITKQAIDSILEKTNYLNYEILLVDNNSDDPQALAYFKEISNHPKVTLLHYPYAFNYSAINNFAVRHAKGTIIGLINNDIEVINPEWLTEMTAQAQRPEIGCVGAMLYYPNDTIQHAGVLIGINGVAAHSHKHYIRKHPGYFSRLYATQNLMAVTAACLLVRKEIFDEVNGLNEKNLTVAFNDVDFCLKVHYAGYRNLWTPYAELYHHESISRGHEDNPEKQARFQREIEYMLKTWKTNTLQDPYYNPNLTLNHEDFSISIISRVTDIE